MAEAVVHEERVFLTKEQGAQAGQREALRVWIAVLLLNRRVRWPHPGYLGAKVKRALPVGRHLLGDLQTSKVQAEHRVDVAAVGHVEGARGEPLPVDAMTRARL